MEKQVRTPTSLEERVQTGLYAVSAGGLGPGRVVLLHAGGPEVLWLPMRDSHGDSPVPARSVNRGHMNATDYMNAADDLLQKTRRPPRPVSVPAAAGEAAAREEAHVKAVLAVAAALDRLAAAVEASR